MRDSPVSNNAHGLVGMRIEKQENTEMLEPDRPIINESPETITESTNPISVDKSTQLERGEDGIQMSIFVVRILRLSTWSAEYRSKSSHGGRGSVG